MKSAAALALYSLFLLVLIFSVDATLDDEQGWFEDDGAVLSATILPSPPKLNAVKGDQSFEIKFNKLKKQVKKMEATLESQRIALVAALKAAAAAHSTSSDVQSAQTKSTQPSTTASDVKTANSNSTSTPAVAAPKQEPKQFHGVGAKMMDLMEKYVNNRTVTEEERVLEKLTAKKKKGKGFVVQKHVSQQFDGLSGKFTSFWNRLRGVDVKSTKGTVLEKQLKEAAKKMAEQRKKFRLQMNAAMKNVEAKIKNTSDPVQKQKLLQYLANLRKYKLNSIEKLKQVEKKRQKAIKKKMRKQFRKGKKNQKKGKKSKQSKKGNKKNKGKKSKQGKKADKKAKKDKKSKQDKKTKKGDKKAKKDGKKDKKSQKNKEKKVKKADNKKPKQNKKGDKKAKKDEKVKKNNKKAEKKAKKGDKKDKKAKKGGKKDKKSQKNKEKKAKKADKKSKQPKKRDNKKEAKKNKDKKSKQSKKSNKKAKKQNGKKRNLKQLFANLRAKLSPKKNQKKSKNSKNAKAPKTKEIGIQQLINHSKILSKKKKLSPLETEFQQKINGAVSQLSELKKGSKEAVAKVLEGLNQAANLWIEQIKSQPNTPAGNAMKQKLEDLQKEAKLSKDSLEQLQVKL